MSATQTEDFEIPSELGDLRIELIESSSEVVQAFIQNVDVFGASSGEFEAKVRHGCIEIADHGTGEYWGMYKAFWSDFARSPRCD